MMTRRSAFLGALTVLLAVGLLQDARADDFTMTGQYRHGCCNFPNLMLGTLPFNDLPFALGGGGLSIRTGQPRATTVVDQVLPGGTLMVPAGAIDMAGTFVNPTPVFPPSFLFLSTQVAFNNAAGTLSPGGGPGNAAYCMNNTTGPNANPNCTLPAQGGAPFGGNLLSHAVPGGAPNFGGTMALLGGLPVVNFARTLGTPVVVASGNNPAIVSVVGNPFASYSVRPQTIMVMSPGGTISPVTTIQEAGLPWGTGTVYGVVTGQTGTFPTLSFSYVGSDGRNASGTGNVTLVSAHVASSNTGFDFINGVRMTVSLPEPGPTLGLAAGLGLLVLVEAMRRRRQG